MKHNQPVGPKHDPLRFQDYCRPGQLLVTNILSIERNCIWQNDINSFRNCPFVIYSIIVTLLILCHVAAFSFAFCLRQTHYNLIFLYIFVYFDILKVWRSVRISTSEHNPLARSFNQEDMQLLADKNWIVCCLGTQWRVCWTIQPSKLEL